MALTTRSKLSDQIYEAIRRNIESEAWVSGMMLATELELSEHYGVSRPVVREALARLKSEKLIDSKRGSGSFVTRAPGPGIKGFQPVGTVVDLIHGFELRMSVEGDAARYAAARRTSDQLEAIQAMADGLRSGGADETFGDADFRFHCAIAAAAGNPMYASTMMMLRDQILFGMRLTGAMSPSAPERVAIVHREHDLIIDAIARQDDQGAKAAMETHLAMSRKRLLGFEPAIDQF